MSDDAAEMLMTVTGPVESTSWGGIQQWENAI